MYKSYCNLLSAAEKNRETFWFSFSPPYPPPPPTPKDSMCVCVVWCDLFLYNIRGNAVVVVFSVIMYNYLLEGLFINFTKSNIFEKIL